MDHQKPDSQKLPQTRLEGSSLRCPECKDLDEHRSKNCPQQLINQDSRDSMDVDSDKEETRSPPCYQCDDCFLSFIGSQSLEEYLQKNSLQMSDIEKSVTRDSYESSIEVLYEAMFAEKNNSDSSKNATLHAHGFVIRYTDVKKRKDNAEQAYQEAVTRERILSTIVSAEEQKILSHIVSENLQKLENAKKALELEKTLLYEAVRQVNLCYRALVYTGIKVHYALSQAIRAFNKRRLSVISSFSSLETEERELETLQDNLKERHALLRQLQVRVVQLNANVTSMIGMDPNKVRPTATQNNNDGRHTMQENVIVGDAQISQIEANTGIHDNQRPSTSGTPSGYTPDSSPETPDNMM